MIKDLTLVEVGARTRPAPSVPKVRLFGLGLAQVHGARRARRARSEKASQAAETSPRERRRDPSCSPSRQGNHCRHCTSKGARSATSCFSRFCFYSPLLTAKKKKSEIATFVCVFYSDLPRDLLLKIDVGVKNIFDRAKSEPRYFPRCYGHQRNRKTSFPSPPMPPPLTRSLHSAAAAALSLSLSLSSSSAGRRAGFKKKTLPPQQTRPRPRPRGG